MDKRSLSAIHCIMMIICILTVSILIPFIWKGFYFMQIDSLEIHKYIALDTEVVKQIYANMIDYCLGFTSEFNIDPMPYSSSGYSHFNDVRKLVRFDMILAIMSSLILIHCGIKKCKKKVMIEKLAGHTPYFWSAVIVIVFDLLVVGMAWMNFDLAWSIFHKILFIGKTNWQFSMLTDPIIIMLPGQFFLNCGLLIIGIQLIWSILLIVIDLRKNK